MSTPPAGATKAILFLGATGGVAFAALRRSLAANHTCIALCRNPATLTTALLAGDSSQDANTTTTTLPANLTIIQGNAHDSGVLASSCLRHPSDPSRLVDAIVFSIGGKPTLKGLDDPHVCERGMTALLEALRTLRKEGADNNKPTGNPRLIAVSSTGVGTLGRELPWAMVPMYKLLLGAAHKDKAVMEKLVIDAGKNGDGEQALVSWTIIRGSLYTNGPATEGKVRAGWEAPVAGTRGDVPIGYTISREDLGKWVYENCIEGGDEWVGKVAVVTY
jgi:nucleoside-diphosphate-sugar epimerase